ncbi:MAG TPA: NAD(P)-dependent alcohol dehydrogenase [Acidimicrobiia bacterium]|nr:NAD(P)-dependent alcohol dehydrogenase [Acidimicrobiia bacterium]
MKAIVYHRYGSPEVLELQEVAKPVVEDDGVLIRVRAASINPYEWHYMRGEPYLARLQMGLKPKTGRLGVDVAGMVEAVGRNVTLLQPGAEVFGTCDGALAEYAVGSESSLVSKPANVSFEQAGAAGIAAFTAIQGLRDFGQVEAGQKVLINGAAGGVGTFAVQLAKTWGAEVTGVCSTRNVDMVRSIGADHVIDYTREDFTLGAKRYDLMLDLIGNHSLTSCRRALTSSGTFVMLGGQSGRWIRPMDRVFKTLLFSPFVSQRLVLGRAVWSRDDLLVMQELLATGLVATVIDRTYPLSQVPEAIRYLEEGHARGKVVITV